MHSDRLFPVIQQGGSTSSPSYLFCLFIPRPAVAGSTPCSLILLLLDPPLCRRDPLQLAHACRALFGTIHQRRRHCLWSGFPQEEGRLVGLEEGVLGQSALVGAQGRVSGESDLQVVPALGLPVGLPLGWPQGLRHVAATEFEAWPAHLAGLPLLGIPIL